MKSPTVESKYELIAFWIMVLAIPIGIYFRLKGLGKWPFTNDEYYLAQSVKNILENGMPSFKCGGYYVRGLSYQYLMVPFVVAGFPEEFSFRMVPVLSSIAAIPALFLLSKKVSGVMVACLVVTLFSLSTWEIEIARFARMYMPFQAIFIWYLLFMYKLMMENDPNARAWMYGLSFISIFIFEGSIFLIILNFLPLITNPRRIKITHVFISILIFAVAYSYFMTIG